MKSFENASCDSGWGGSAYVHLLLYLYGNMLKYICQVGNTNSILSQHYMLDRLDFRKYFWCLFSLNITLISQNNNFVKF